jgi:hypothetical protein
MISQPVHLQLTALMEETKPRARRQNLIDEMDRLIASDLTCVACSGLCCSFEANTMMVTPLEALELFYFLVSRKLWDSSLVNQITTCISRSRLDQSPPGNGRRDFARRSYTCPFYLEKAQGCIISRGFKPYGCLAFNPHEAGLTAGGGCHSNQQALVFREEANQRSEARWNDRIITQLDLSWKKETIPVAIMAMASHFL